MHFGRNHLNIPYMLVGTVFAQLLRKKIRGNYRWKHSCKTSATSSAAVKANKIMAILIR